MSERTCILLLGAGASRGCATTKNWTDNNHLPPLAAELFKMTRDSRLEQWTIMSRFPGAMHVAHQLENIEQTDDFNLEKALAAFATSDAAIDLQSFAHVPLYLAALFREVSKQYLPEEDPGNYYLLLRRLCHNAHFRVAAVSLNYDTLLEAAIKTLFGWEYSHIHNYYSRNQVAVLKPHGSWNWRKKIQFKNKGGTENLFTFREVSGPISVSESDVREVFRALNDPHKWIVDYPVLTAPVLEKSPVWTDDMQKLLSEYARTADRLLVIGSSCWDAHVISSIAKATPSPCKVHLVNDVDGSRLTEIALRFKKAWGKPLDETLTPISMTFGEYLSSSEFADFMSG